MCVNFGCGREEKTQRFKKDIFDEKIFIEKSFFSNKNRFIINLSWNIISLCSKKYLFLV